MDSACMRSTSTFSGNKWQSERAAELPSFHWLNYGFLESSAVASSRPISAVFCRPQLGSWDISPRASSLFSNAADIYKDSNMICYCFHSAPTRLGRHGSSRKILSEILSFTMWKDLWLHLERYIFEMKNSKSLGHHLKYIKSSWSDKPLSF